MRRFYLSFLLLFFLLITVVLNISCGVGKKSGNELRYGFATEPSTLDPLSTENTADGRTILFNIFEGLVKPDVHGTMQPCMAEAWTIEDGGQAYSFIIREGVHFHDGSFLSAADVKFTLDTAIANGLSGLRNIEEVIITSDNRVRVVLKNTDPDFLPYLTIGIVKAGNEDREKNIIGTGPFYVEKYTKQRSLELRKFDNYWQSGLPHLDKVTIVFFANYDTLMVAFRGSIDGASLTGSMAAQLDHRQYDVFSNSSAAVQLMALNNQNPPFNDIRVRRAVNYGIDIQEIINIAFFGSGTPSGSPVIPGLSDYYEESLAYVYNPDMALSLLSQAGFNSSNALSFEITVPSNYTMHVDTAQVIVNQLERIGVNASIRLVDWNTWLSNVYRGRNYQATIVSLDSPNVSARSFLNRYLSNNSGNFINFSSADYDRVFNSALSETDPEKRKTFYKQAQRIIAENAASVYLQDILYFTALKGGSFAGVLDYPLYVIDFSSIYGINE
ncbi:MAG: ABC transporter substrate-binding protein [Treponema sp.]|nr:ABC transporter substrate-binding protein [Treponema sp.]